MKQIKRFLAAAVLTGCLMPLGISAAPDTPENKLIALRHQMESAQTIKQQKKIPI